MAKITELNFRHKGYEYGLTIDFDDAALMEDLIAFDVIASRKNGADKDINIAVRVEIDSPNQLIRVIVNEEVVLEIGIFEDESQVEQAINSIPAGLLGDPITGCAIKAGVSAIVGQAINCARSLEAQAMFARVPEYFKCMASNFGNISTVAMYRAFTCILNCG